MTLISIEKSKDMLKKYKRAIEQTRYLIRLVTNYSGHFDIKQMNAYHI